MEIILGQARRCSSEDEERALVAETFIDGETVTALLTPRGAKVYRAHIADRLYTLRLPDPTAPMTLPLLQALQPDRICGRLQAGRFALPVGARPLVQPTPTMRGKSSDGDFTL